MQITKSPSGHPVRMRWATVGFLFLIIITFLPSLYQGISYNPSWQFYIPKVKEASGMNSNATFYQADFIQSERQTPSVHSPSIVELNDGNLLAVWYGGTREGAKDVAIYNSVWDSHVGKWTEGRVLTGPEDTQKDLGRYIKKVGNPVLFKDLSGRIWLFYVTVSLGGWSGSSVNYRISADNGTNWSKAIRLVSSPFLNISTLVRGTPFLFSDGSIGLPVYHEFLGKLGELLRVAPDGTIVDKVRITWGRSSLQPSIIPLDSIQGIVFLRRSGSAPARILYSLTGDGGRSWSHPGILSFPNPDSSVMGMRTQEGSLLLVFNNSETNRDNLSLAISRDDGQTWDVAHVFDERMPANDGSRIEFSYPSWIQTNDGMIHLVYTWNRKRIRHVYFNSSWLEGL